MEEKYIVKTSVGKFRVDKTKSHLRIGGKKFCVEIKLADQELQWLITKDGGCELDNIEIQGSKTLHMLNLSFTLLRTYTNTNKIKLLDNSKFDCELADGTKTVIFMNKYSYLFYGGTWYDVKANAVPIDPSQEALYQETKSLYNDPSILIFLISMYPSKYILPVFSFVDLSHLRKPYQLFSNILHRFQLLR